MSRNGKVIVAISGGVDSSVAAGLLREQGYECVGVFMWAGRGATKPRSRGATEGENETRVRQPCCSAQAAGDARMIADRLGIPFQVLDFQAEFERITEYFVDEYARARTPNPCVVCNSRLKFGKLLRYADSVGAEFVATGHYARVLEQDGQLSLARARNQAKDQSYVLFGIRRRNLSRCLFPLGEIEDKARVRRMAADLGLPVHDKPESQEICFVPGDDYKRLIRERRPETLRPGEVRNAAGNVLGTHDGIANYTIGQRRGLGIATGEPVYVTRLDAGDNTVTIGPREDLLSPGLIADQVNWLSEPGAGGGWRPAEIKIRYQHRAAAGSIRVLGSGDLEARFDQPQPAVTPGQAVVCYREDGIVLGGGWIRSALEQS